MASSIGFWKIEFRKVERNNIVCLRMLCKTTGCRRCSSRRSWKPAVEKLRSCSTFACSLAGCGNSPYQLLTLNLARSYEARSCNSAEPRKKRPRLWDPARRSAEAVSQIFSFLFSLALGALIGLGQILSRLFEGGEGIVIGLDGLAVFVDGALALAGNVKDLAQLQMAPDFGPAGLSVAVDGGAIGVGRRLVVSLLEEDFRDAVMGKGTVLVDIEGLVELGERTGEVALLLHGHAPQDGRTELYIRRIGEHVVVGID